METPPVKATAALEFKSLSIKSNGTKAGSTILLNGEPIKNLAALNFSFYDDCYGPAIRLGITTREKPTKPGNFSQMSFWELQPPPEPKATAEAGQLELFGTLEPRQVIPAECMPRDAKNTAYKSM